ncbi:MAG TPA: ATP-binding cassette domain-containing protein [Aurantimonas sp.]|jgi:iron complex transport system ATP-binding protein|nr:ATP-binding cassette domain-containing protein [Aurantimonas sp.]
MMSELSPPAGTPDADAREAAFVLEGLGFAVDGKPLLQPLTLDLPGGAVIGLVGHNGSGKSTLVKILARQQEATSGSVRFKRRRLAEWRERSFAREVAYLPQQTPLAPGMRVRELVALGRYPWHGALGRFGPRDHAQVDEALALTETEGFADRHVETLSGGERQRVWLAMLIAQDAGCLLLDEPISALDIAHQVEVLGLIRRLSQTRGVTVVVVLHEINMAARFCEDIVALRRGQLVARGAPAAIMTPAVLERIYRIPMGVVASPDGGEPLAFVRR